jgi:RimJ/RimL family protein N-acetyltransferase
MGEGTNRPPEITLREVREHDLEIFFQQQLDPDAVAMAAFPARTREEHFPHWREVLATDSNVTRTIVVDGEVAGNVVSWIQDGQRMVGYWIGKTFWGRGIATEALRRFLEVLPERPLHAWVAPHNIASIRVLEKCGFRLADVQPAAGDAADMHVVLELPSAEGPEV